MQLVLAFATLCVVSDRIFIQHPDQHSGDLKVATPEGLRSVKRADERKSEENR